MGTKNDLHTAVAVELARRGLTQAELAHRAGMAPSSLSGWLRGIWPPQPGFVEKLEAALDLTPGTLPSAGDRRATG